MKNRQRPLSMVIVFAFLLTAFDLLPSAVRGQTATATLGGTVEDEKGAVVPGVTVAVLNVDTSFRRESTTNEGGSFLFTLLPPGRYSLTAERQGFKVLQVPNIVMNVGDQKALTIQLQTGNISETVRITGEAPLINDSPAVGTTVDGNQVDNMPLNGRSFQTLVALTPGVVLTKPTTVGENRGQFSINGQRADANYFTVDGVGANIGISTFLGAVAFSGGSVPGFSALGGTNNLVSVDALQEFKVQTSTYAPEFGRTPGGQVSIVTRSGTNSFHGSAFDYFRNDALDANDWFANSARLSRPALRQNDFGGVLGGPVIKNHTFFFFSYEGLRLRQPKVRITTVPSLASRRNAPPQIQPFLNAFPLPNGPDTSGGSARLSAGYSDPSTLDATSIRVDHTVNARLTLFGRYNHAPSESSARNFNPSVVVLTQTKTETLTVGATLAASPAVSNDLRFNWSRNSSPTSDSLDNFGGAVPPPNSILFPSFASATTSTLRLVIGSPLQSIVAGTFTSPSQRQLNIIDNLSYATGSHQLKFGVDYRRLSPVYSPPKYFLFERTSSVNSAIAGNATLLQIAAFDGPFFPLFANFSAFAQDTWKIHPRLTLTYGLRWEFNPPPSEKNGKDAFTVIGLDNPATMTLAPKGTSFWKATYYNFAPRVGLVYQLFNRHGRETLVRGGFGIFYDLGNGDAARGFGGYPFETTTTITNVPFPINLATLQPPAFKANPLLPPYDGGVYASDPHLKLPFTYQWNVALQQSLGSQQVFTASYVAALGRRLLRTDALFQPNPNFTDTVLVIRNGATSDYHALQLQFQRRLSRGLQALVSYTWSHAIDDASDNESINPAVSLLKPTTDRGPSDFDIRHAFTGSIIYNFPAPSISKVPRAILSNWSANTIFFAHSATPVNVIAGTDVLGAGALAQFTARPDLIIGVPLYINDPAVAGGRRINAAAFKIPTTARQGTLGRNALRGFRAWQLDFALRRQFGLSERVTMQVGAEFFNLFNHPNFADPDGNLQDAFFGQSTSMLRTELGGSGGLNSLYQIGGPRSIQLAVKLRW